VNDPQLLLEKERLLRQELEIQEGLPHLHGWKFYKWARAFYESNNKMNLLCAANQISKSSTQIRKCIDWATNPKKWKKLWGRAPLQFWYLYPNKLTATVEFEKKWIPEFMPRGKFKDDPQYGWKEEYKNKEIFAIHFNTGVTVYFKAYSQDAQDLQTGTCYAIFCFVKGTKVATPSGDKCVSEVRVGDLVHTHKGHRRVVRTGSRLSSVIQVTFSDGKILIGTPEHPIWTDNRGWVNLGDLTEKDICYSVPECENTSNSSYLKENCTREIRRQRISVQKTISGIGLTDFYTKIFGKPTLVEKYRTVLSYITQTITRLITRQKTLFLCQGQSIQGTINLKSGKHRGYFSTCAKILSAVEFSLVEALRKILPVQKSVGLKDILNQDGALYAIKSTPVDETKSSSVSVVKIARIREKRRVYNLEVEDAHTYYANGILTHNCDEELPDNLYDELTFRLAATDGYFHQVFTATLGQQMWEDAIEGKGVNEKFPDAFKLQVSMYDCLTYEDGTKSHWTPERIQRIKNQCKSEQEIQRRVYGKFVKEEGLKYPSFDRNKNVKKRHPVPSNWKYYAGVDIGGGGSGHPAAIVFLAVSPDYRKGRIIKGWRGDGITTTAKDVFDKFVEMRGNIRFESQYYDWQAKDFFVIASRLGEPFTPADKSHESGESILNVLFKNEMLCIYDDEDEYELKKLVGELSRLNKNTPKNKAIDDFTDALRYTVTKVPWDFEGAITSDDMARKPAPNNRQIELQERKDYSTMLEDEFNFNVDEELSEWDEYLEG